MNLICVDLVEVVVESFDLFKVKGFDVVVVVSFVYHNIAKYRIVSAVRDPGAFHAVEGDCGIVSC